MVEANVGAPPVESHDQEVPEWMKFIPHTLGETGDQLSYKLDDAIALIETKNLRAYNIPKLKELYARLDPEKLAELNEKSKVIDDEWLVPYREIKYLSQRLYAVPGINKFPPFNTPEEANAAIDRIGELCQPYLKPKQVK